MVVDSMGELNGVVLALLESQLNRILSRGFDPELG
jgi:hypothetical protein